jgi:hypothetical protein
MAARIVKEFKGHSGSRIFLMTKHDRLFVRKQGNITRNFDRYEHLKLLHVPMPTIYHMFDDTIDMEYIDGIDVQTFLSDHSPDLLIDFLTRLINKFSMTIQSVDYRPVVEKFLDLVDLDEWPFTAAELIAYVPATLPKSPYHGDLTLENLIWNSSQGFVAIDGQSGIWDSYVFDLCKLRQDLHCHWFVRNVNHDLSDKLEYIETALLNRWPVANNRALLTLMLLRVYRYCREGSLEQDFIKKEINRLWK